MDEIETDHMVESITELGCRRVAISMHDPVCESRLGDDLAADRRAAGRSSTVATPDGRDLDIGIRTANALLRSVRCLGERAFALLTSAAPASTVTASPGKITDRARAALVLTRYEHGYIK